MKNTIILIALFSGISLTACDKTTVDKTPETVVVPVPVPVPMAGPAGATGATGAVGEKGTAGKAGDEGIQGEPGKPGGNTTIIIPPPKANMPPDIVPEPSSVTPAK